MPPTDAAKADPRPPLRVRYYPRRIGRPAAPAPLSPGQALHLVDDPARAALARHTADGRDLDDARPAARTNRPGWWRRLTRRR